MKTLYSVYRALEPYLVVLEVNCYLGHVKKRNVM